MIGTDIVDIKELKKIIESKHGQAFLKKVYTKQELSYCDSDIHHLATTYAAKEAVFKALGEEFFEPKKIEILRNQSGKPYTKNALISLSYTESHAIAIALNNKK